MSKSRVLADLVISGNAGGGGTVSPTSDLTANTLNLLGNAIALSTLTGTLKVKGGVGVTGNVYADRLYGNGAALTGITTAIAIKEEGTTVASTIRSIDFVGATVTAQEISTNNVRVTIGSTSTVDNYVSRNYTGDGTTTSFGVGSNISSSSALVFYNGVAQTPGTDYTVGAGSITFVSAPTANSKVHIRELSTSGFVSYLQPGRDKFFSYGNTPIFTLSRSPQNTFQTLVFVNGILQDSPSNYEISDRTLTFTSTPLYGDEITVAYDVADSNYDPGTSRQIALAMLFSSY